MSYEGTSRGMPSAVREGSRTFEDSRGYGSSRNFEGRDYASSQGHRGSQHYQGVPLANYRGTSSRSFLDDLNHAVSANPVAAGLVGAGLLWMLFGNKRIGQVGHLGADVARSAAGATGNAIGAAGSAASSAGRMMASGISTASSQIANAAGQIAGSVGDVAGQVADAARHAGESIASTAQSAAGSLSDAASSGVRQATSAMESMMPSADAVRGNANAGAHYAEGMATDGVRAVQEYGDSFRQTVTRAIDSQPLLIGAIGLAVGAGIAAAFRTTSIENRLMGEAGDAVRDQFGDLAAQAKEMAEARASEAAAKLKEQGLNLSNPTETLKAVADKVSKVASAAGDSAKSRLS